jgi:hypothetical protein
VWRGVVERVEEAVEQVGIEVVVGRDVEGLIRWLGEEGSFAVVDADDGAAA